MRSIAMQPAVPFILLLANSGLQLSAFSNLYVAISLWVVAGLWFAALVAPKSLCGKFVRMLFRKPFVLNPETESQKQQEFQWLLDMAENQRANPTTHLVITDRIIMGVQLDARRPLLALRVCFANYGVNDLVVSNPEGYPYFGKERSSDYIRDDGCKHNVPAGNTATTFNLDIYVPAEFLEDVQREVESTSSEVSGISLRQLRANVRAKDEGPIEIEWSIGGHREIFRPNR